MSRFHRVLGGMSAVLNPALVAFIALVTGAASGFSHWPGPLDLARQYAFPITILVVSGTGLHALWKYVLSSASDATDPVPPALLCPDEWVVDREQVAQTVAAVRARRRTVGITTALRGAGGFGKTTLAAMVCADARVRRRFRDRVYWVTIGRDVRGREAIAAKVTAVVRMITGDATPFDDPETAGAHLGGVLNQRGRILLVLDDVWTPEQLAPFLRGGPRCVRLVTTRVPAVLPPSGTTVVKVDEMSPEQGRSVLNRDLPESLPQTILEGLLRATGRWPLLLRMANRLIVAERATGMDAEAAAVEVLHRLRTDGPTATDAPHSMGLLDPGDPAQRSRAVRVSLEAAIRLVPPGGDARFDELGVFAEDEMIPVSLIAGLWQATGGLTPRESRALIRDLGSLSLLSYDDRDGGHVSLHDVIRDFLRAGLGAARLVALHGTVVDTAAAMSAAARPTTSATAAQVPGPAWWDLPDGYLFDQVVMHMVEAGRTADAEALAGDMCWIEARLGRRDRTAPWLDLTRVPGSGAAERARDLARVAHLLAPTDPPDALVSVLHSRLGDLPAWRDRVAERERRLTGPHLTNAWPLPDLPHPGLERILTGHTGGVTSLAIAPDGAWLASAAYDGTVRLWERGTGAEIATCVGHDQAVVAVASPAPVVRSVGPKIVTAVAISPDGTWIASAGVDRSVRIWDRITGAEAAVLYGHDTDVTAMAIWPGGAWVVSADRNGRVRVRDRVTGAKIVTFTRNRFTVNAVVVSPDGTWLAGACDDGGIRIWDPVTGTEIASLTRGRAHRVKVTALAVSPDGTWLAGAGEDGTVRIWDRVTRTETAMLTGHTGAVTAVAVSPDATWLAGAGEDRTVRIWDRAGGVEIAALEHTAAVTALAISPDGTWAASGGRDHRVRVWRQPRRIVSARAFAVDAVAVSPDGTWLVGAGSDRTVRIRDSATGRETAVLRHPVAVSTVAVSPDAACVASGDVDGVVRIWDPVGGAETGRLTGRAGRVTSLVFSPDGTWLAGAVGRRVLVWERATGAVTATLTHGKTHWKRKVTAVAVSPDGAWLVSAGEDRTIRVWDLGTGTRTTTLRNPDPVGALAVSPDGAWVVSGDEGGVVRIRDRATGAESVTLAGHAGRVTSLAFSPDGTWLASTGNDSTLRIWDPSAARAVTMTRVDAPLTACAWTPDGQCVTSGGQLGLYLFRFHR